MKKLTPYFLMLILVSLAGCEGLPENNSSTSLNFSTPGSNSSTSLNFSAPIIKEVKGTDFSSKKTALKEAVVVTPIKMDLDKNDILYTFLSAPENNSSTSLNFSAPVIKEFKGTDFSLEESIKSDQTQGGAKALTWSEKQAKIKEINEKTLILLKNNSISEQVRNEDHDSKLEADLKKLEKNIVVNKKKTAQLIKSELKHKIRLLDAETTLKAAEFKVLANTRSNAIVAKVEDIALSATSGARKKLIKEMFSVEPENYYQLKQEGKRLDAVYQVDVAKAKLKYQKQIDVIEVDVKSLRVANKRIISNRLSELEDQRISEALIIETKIKAKNRKIVNKSYPEFEAKILKYTNAFKENLAQREESVLSRLSTEYTNEKFDRKSTRELENRQYVASINQKIEQEQLSYEDQSRDRLNASRDAKINSINANLKRSIKSIESGGVQALADLKSKNAREHQKQKNVLQAPYKKKEQALNQKYQQDKSKILSRFRAEEYAVVAKIRKETAAANREIDVRVKAEIRALLDSFEALKKEEAAEAKKNSLEKPKKSPGFFESLF